MNSADFSELGQRLDALLGLRCWYVSCGGAAGPTFTLVLGKKVARPVPLTNLAHAENYRQNEGEANLLVWCSWRLDEPDQPVTSSDDTTQAIAQGLGRIVGATLTSLEASPPAWDLKLAFSNGLRLSVFCDHVPGDPSFDGNWELWQQDKAFFVGPGNQVLAETPRIEPASAQP